MRLARDAYLIIDARGDFVDVEIDGIVDCVTQATRLAEERREPLACVAVSPIGLHYLFRIVGLPRRREETIWGHRHRTVRFARELWHELHRRLAAEHRGGVPAQFSFIEQLFQHEE